MQSQHHEVHSKNAAVRNDIPIHIPIHILTVNSGKQSPAGNAPRAAPTKMRANPGVNSRLIEKTTKG